MKKIANLTIWIFFYIFLFSLILHNSYTYLDPDLGTHLKIGQEILENKEIPHEIIYSYPLQGERWVDHEWLMKIVSFSIFSAYGYLALSVFFSLLAILVLILLNLFIHKNFLKNQNEFLFVLVFQLLGVMAIMPHIGVRMQEITLLFLLLEIIIIYYFNKSKNYKILWGLLPLFYLWACCHAGFLLGLCVLGFFVFIKILEILIYKYCPRPYFDFSKILNKKNIIIFSIFSFFAFLATLLTPYGLELYAFLADYTNTYYLKQIHEWLPQYYFPFNFWQIIYIAILTTFSGIIIHSAVKEKRSYINMWQVGLVIVFTYLAIKSKRHFPLLFIVSFPFLIQALKISMPLPRNWLNKNSLIKKIFYFYLVSAFVLLSILYFSKTSYTQDPFTSFSSRYPLEAVNFLKNNPQYDDFKIFNPYGWGGYMMWTYPERKLFIDGRFSQFNFEKHTMLEEYHDFFDKEKSEEKLNQHGIGIILLDGRDRKYKLNWLEKSFFGIDENKLNNKENNLKKYLNSANSWKIIYEDDVSLIYLKPNEN